MPNTKIRVRRGTAAQWASADPLLLSGEIGAETDTGKIKVGNGSNNWTGLPYAGGPTGPPGAGFVDAADYGVLANGVTDDTDAWNDALDTLQSDGGGTLSFPATANQSIIGGPVYVPGSVGIWGTGGKWQEGGTASVFRTVDDGCIQFGNGTAIGDTGQGPVSGNFQIDGSDGGEEAGLFQSLLNIERNFQSINVLNAPGDAFLIEQTQNSNFTRCSSNNAAQDGLVLDKGAGSLLFSGFEFAASGRDGISIKATAGSWPYPSVQLVRFLLGIIEYANDTTNTFRNMVRAISAERIIFDQCAIGAAGVNGSASRLMHLDGGNYTLRDTTFVGNHATTGAEAVWAKNTSLHLSGDNRFLTVPTAVTADTTMLLSADKIPFYSSVATRWAVANGATFNQNHVPQPQGSAFVGSGTSIALNPLQYAHQTVVLNANTTCAALPTTLAAGILPGQKFRISVLGQGGTPTFAWPTGIGWHGTAPAISNTSDTYVSADLVFTGFGWVEQSRSG